MKLFGRNKDRPHPEEYCTPEAFEIESKRVLKHVTYQDVGAEEYEPYWGPFDSIFQEVAFNGSYPDIFEFLCKTNSKVVFDD